MANQFVLYRLEEPDGREFISRKEKDAITRATEIMTEYREVESVEIYQCLTVILTKDAIIDIITSHGGSWLEDEELHRTIYRK